MAVRILERPACGVSEAADGRWKGGFMDTLAQMGLGRAAFAAVIIFVCLLLMLVILLQKGRGVGLAGAFGGGGGTSAFGAKTGDVFTWITVVVAAVFVLLAVFGNFLFDQSAVATVETPVATEPTRVVLPVEGDVDTATVSLEQTLPDGTVVSTPLEVELITEPADESMEGEAAAGQPEGTKPGEASPPKPKEDTPGSKEEGVPPSDDKAPSAP